MMILPRENANKKARNNIMLVGLDNEHNNLMFSYLDDNNTRVKMVDDWVDALELFVEGSFTAILIDLHMPYMNGQKLIREIQARNNGEVKIIAISSTYEHLNVMTEDGVIVDYYITTPFNKDYVRVVVNLASANTAFFREHWAEIRERWVESFPKQGAATDTNLVEEVDKFLHNHVVTTSPHHRVGLLPDRSNAPHHEPSADPEDKRPEYLAALLGTVPKDARFEEKCESLSDLSHEFRQRVAAELAPALNAKIQGMEHDTLDQKKELARWVNDQLEPFGLAVQCPNTGRPAKFRATTGSSSWPDVGRFYFETIKNGKQTKSAFSGSLPVLTLMDATPSKELDSPEAGSETHWQEEVGSKSTRTGRKRT